ncbi:M15 family metallopeptidase [Cellulomonas sp.]|uniref:M15 family metallopeptidase n=1 Tax=Cellulomonas sp. TaxID=40001 RepID=UPI003BA850C4
MTLYVGRLPERVRRRRARWAVASAVVVVCVAVVGLVHALGSAATPGPTPTAQGLSPELEQRFAAAQEAAELAGVPLTLTSGWRSAAEQQALVDDAVERYGSIEEARRWVLPPESSAHVQGTAIDVGPTDGALWLGEHGFELGLCRTYANEIWHFELLDDGATTCPELHPDSSSGW